MATLKQRLHRKNNSGSYDVIYLETSADLVKRADGTTVEAALTSAESSISSLESAIESVSGSKKFYGTISTEWVSDDIGSIKIQEVPIPGILESMDLCQLGVIMTHNRTKEGYTAFVDEIIQFRKYITNGDAETYGTDETNGGVRFYVYADTPAISIPFGLVVN